MRTLCGILRFLAVAASVLLTQCGGSDNPSSDLPPDSTSSVEGGTVQPLGEVEDRLTVPAQKLPPLRPKDRYVVIDRYCNRLYLRTADSVLLDATCSTGSNGELVDSATGRCWRFGTPTGVFVVSTKMRNPWWRKPDWAFIEEGEPIPTSDSDRLDPEVMGDYAIGFGDGYFIHGTIYERLLGVAVTHGCVRLASADLRELYRRTEIGTRIYVY